MKKAIVTIAITAAAVFGAAARTTAVVSFSNPQTAAIEVDLLSGSKMTFSDANLLFVSTPQPQDPVPLKGIEKITFTRDWSEVATVDRDAATLRLAENPVGESLRIVGHASGNPTRLSVFSISGREAVRISSWDGEDVDVSHLPKGVYILRVDSKTIKFVKK